MSDDVDLRKALAADYMNLDRLRERAETGPYPEKVETLVGVSMVALRNAMDLLDRQAELATDGGVDDSERECDGCQQREAEHEYDDGSAYCEECHVANIDAARSVGWEP